MRPTETDEPPLVAERLIAESMATSCDDLVFFADLLCRGLRRVFHALGGLLGLNARPTR